MTEKHRWAVYAAITAALATRHPKSAAVARALEGLTIDPINAKVTR